MYVCTYVHACMYVRTMSYAPHITCCPPGSLSTAYLSTKTSTTGHLPSDLAWSTAFGPLTRTGQGRGRAAAPWGSITGPLSVEGSLSPSLGAGPSVEVPSLGLTAAGVLGGCWLVGSGMVNSGEGVVLASGLPGVLPTKG